MYRIKDREEEEKLFYFNSIPFDVVSNNNISAIVNNVVNEYEIDISKSQMVRIGDLEDLLNLVYHQQLLNPL